MYTVLFYFFGTVHLKIRGTRVLWLLQLLAQERVILRNIRIINDTELHVTVLKKHREKVNACMKKSACEIIEEKESGFSVTFRHALKRPILLIGLLLAIVIGITVPKFVFFYTVEGNVTVPTEKILRELHQLGVGFGTFGPSIHPQEIKNRMLLRIPELSWITVQQSGACANVVVRERPQKLPVLDRKTPKDLIAVRSGIITKTEILQGNPLVKAGDLVSKGQTLISAYNPLDYSVEVSTSIGEVYARTVHRYQVVCPKILHKRMNPATSRSVYLVVGRTRILISGGDELSSLTAHKTVQRKNFRLFGDYILPIYIEKITKTDYDTDEVELDMNSARLLLSETAYGYTAEQMIAGTILKQNEPTEADVKSCRYYASLICEEMIARAENAQLLKDEFTNDGKNDQRRTGGNAD